MSERKIGFYFASDANKSNHDYTVFVTTNGRMVTLGARYECSAPNVNYEIVMDADDLQAFGQLCIDLAKQIGT